jgi:hypothetical protein
MVISAAVISAGAAVAGAATAAYGAVQNASAQKEMSQASQRAEDARRKQAQLQAAREQRKIFRDAQAANAVGRANITNAGAQYGTALPGLYGQTAGALDQQSTDLAQNLEQGMNIFDANADYSRASGRAATAAGMTSLGKDIFTSAEKIGRVGETIFGHPNSDPSRMSWAANTRISRG